MDQRRIRRSRDRVRGRGLAGLRQFLAERGLGPVQRARQTIGDIVGQIRALRYAAAMVRTHHWRPDGRGYPQGLRGDDIPLFARIVHVADAYDAMTSARAYRGARPCGEALRELWRCAGTEFHAEIVGALATVLPGITSEAGELMMEAISA